MHALAQRSIRKINFTSPVCTGIMCGVNPNPTAPAKHQETQYYYDAGAKLVNTDKEQLFGTFHFPRFKLSEL